MPKVSVIIPFHNTEKYMERCARSLFNQTLEDIEFIFVNDCSSDCSEEILNKVLTKYPQRIPQTKILVNEDNIGSSLSRFRGLSAASGDYVIACDGDDAVEPQMYELLYNEATSCSSDIVICNFELIYPDGRLVLSSPQKPSDDLLADLLTGKIFNYLWNKLIKRSLFENDIVRPNASVWEDVGIISQIATYCKRVSYINKALYQYYVTPGSLMNSSDKGKRIVEMITNVRLIEDFLTDKGIIKEYSRLLIRHKAYILTSCFDYPRKEYFGMFPEINIRLLFSPYVPMSGKLGHLTKLLGIHGISRNFRKL